MIRLLCIVLLALVPSIAGAAITCTFSSTPGMGFGPYDDSSLTNTNSTTAIVVRCTRIFGANSANVVLQLGPGSFGTIPARQMRSGANPMNYNLYRDAGRTLVWGQTPGVDTVTINTGMLTNFASRNLTFTIYGRIPALQNTPAGAYTDSVQITVSP